MLSVNFVQESVSLYLLVVWKHFNFYYNRLPHFVL